MKNETDIWTRMMMDFIESRTGRALMDMPDEEQKEFIKENKQCNFVKVIGDK